MITFELNRFELSSFELSSFELSSFELSSLAESGLEYVTNKCAGLEMRRSRVKRLRRGRPPRFLPSKTRGTG